jgi:hypothetical protein
MKGVVLTHLHVALLLLLMAAGDISLKDAAAHLLWLMLKVRAAGREPGWDGCRETGVGAGCVVWELSSGVRHAALLGQTAGLPNNLIPAAVTVVCVAAGA